MEDGQKLKMNVGGKKRRLWTWHYLGHYPPWWQHIFGAKLEKPSINATHLPTLTIICNFGCAKFNKYLYILPPSLELCFF
jgi:hypothetical protein